MKIIKNIILLPFLPLRLAWRWSGGAKITSAGAKITSAGALWNKKDEDGNDIVIEKGGCLPRLLGTIIIAGILYAAIIHGCIYLFDKYFK